MKIETVAIVGAGTMGCGTALDLAAAGYTVLLKDIDSTVVARGRKKLEQEFRSAKMMGRVWDPVSLEEILERIRIQETYDGFSGAQLVIENIVEDFDTKQREYARLIPHCSSDTFFAINTSCISITKIAALFPCPARVIGTHFMNPVPIKSMVEVVRGFHTSEDTVGSVVSFLGTLKKTAVVVNDFPGFVSNRVSHLFMNEAAFLVQDGVATASQVDTIFKQGYGHKMGPLETADLIGLDTVVRSLDVLLDAYGDSKFRCSPLLRKMVSAGLLGQKTGRGFYKY